MDSHEGDEYFLIAFNERPQVLLDGTRDGTSVVDRLSIAEPHGATALYDACYLGVEKLTTSSYAKHALLLISDGEDNNSRYMLDQVRKLLRESDVTVYSIGIADLINLTGKAGARARAALEGIEGMTGGRAFYPSSGAGMDATFEQIAIELPVFPGLPSAKFRCRR